MCYAPTILARLRLLVPRSGVFQPDGTFAMYTAGMGRIQVVCMAFNVTRGFVRITSWWSIKPFRPANPRTALYTPLPIEIKNKKGNSRRKIIENTLSER